MKWTVILLSVLVLLCSGLMTKEIRYAEEDFLEKQKFVFNVMQHVHQDDIYGHEYDELRNYKIEDNLDSYNSPEKVKEFIEFYRTHYVSTEEYFTVFDQYHGIYTKGLTRAIYFAKDFETYKKTVLWARFNIVKELFVYVMHIATLARPDMQGIIFPPIYEINPNYFFTAETIQKAQSSKMKSFKGLKPVEDIYTVVIPTNYTGMYGHFHEEKLLSYFTEDIGLNAFYYYYNIDYPYWTKGQPEALLNNDERGSIYLYFHWQFLARYYMERLSHNLGEIEEFNWNGKLPIGYDSGLRYYSGIHFPVRPYDYKYYNSETYKLVDVAKLYEERIMESIARRSVIQKDFSTEKLGERGKIMNIFGNIIQGSADSVNEQYYGNLDMTMRFIINDGVPYGTYEHILPGALMNYETSMRDPAFYQMYKRILSIIWHFSKNLPYYTEKELGFDGVKIEGVEVDKLVTYFDKFDSDITNAVDVEPMNEAVATELGKFGRLCQIDGQDFVIKARQRRLNHLPFTVKVNVQSDKAQKAMVKIFLAPKYDSYGNQIYPVINRENFFQLEHFITDLVPGQNVITRNSDDFTNFIKDRTTTFELYKKLMMATKREDYKFPLDMSEAHCYFPNRLMLPIGKKGGMPFQIFVIVRPYIQPKTPKFKGFDPLVSCGVGSGARYIDDTPLGYPFDRPLGQQYWPLDNMYFLDVLIHHKTEAEVIAIHH